MIKQKLTSLAGEVFRHACLLFQREPSSFKSCFNRISSDMFYVGMFIINMFKPRKKNGMLQKKCLNMLNFLKPKNAPKNAPLCNPT